MLTVNGDTGIAVRRGDGCAAESRNDGRLGNDLGDRGEVMAVGEDGAEDWRMKDVRVRETLDSNRSNSFAVARRSSSLLWNALEAISKQPIATVAMYENLIKVRLDSSI